MIQPCSPTNQRVHPAKETKPGACSQPHAHTRPNPESPRFSPERAKKKSRNQKGKASFSLSSRSTTTTTRDELTAANRPARAAIPTAANKPASAPTPPIQPDDRDELEKLLSAKHRPLSDIVGDFFAKFPRERRPSINHLLRVILNENRLNPEERLAAYAMLHQSIASVSENPDFSLLLDAASHESVDYSDRAFIQLLITASTKVLKQSPADYIDGNILSSMDLFPWEILEKRAMSKQQALVKLKDLCCILGISFKDKMLEFGVDEPDRERVVSSVEILQATAKINFNKLKIVATGLISEWKAANTPFKQMAWFNWVLEVHDTRSVDDVFGTNYLSTAAVIKAEKELSHLQTERLKKWRTKYLSQKKKLMKLLNDTHLKCGYVGFDPDEKVEAENCRREKKKLKDIIPGVKLLVKDRKELVLRVELLKRAVKSSNASLEAVEVMFTKAMEAAEKIGGGSASYDGEALEDVLRSLLKSPKQDAAERDEPVLQQPIEAITTKTRSGESFPILK